MASVTRTTTIYGSGANRVDLIMSAQETSVLSDSNQSRVAVSLSLQFFGSYCNGTQYIYDAYVSVGGTKVGRRTSGASPQSRFEGGVWPVISGATTTITHNSDGTKSVSVYGSYNGHTTSTATLTLTPIALKGSGTFAEDPVTINSSSTDPALTFTVTPRNPDYYHYVTLYTGNALYPAMQGWAEDNAYTFTATVNNVLTGFSATANGRASAKVETYKTKQRITSELVGETVAYCTVIIDTATIHPDIAVDSVSALSTPIPGVIVAGYSTAEVTLSNLFFGTTVTAQMSKGTVAAANRFSVDTDVLPASGTDYNITATITATDQRGGKDTKTATIPVKGYTRPAPKITAYRVGSNGSTTYDEAGTYVYVNKSCTITPLGSNAIQSESISYAGDISGTINSTPAWIALGTGQGVTITYTATDLVTTGTAVKSVPVAIFPLDLYQENGDVGAAFGGVAVGGLVRSFLPFSTLLPLITESSTASSTLDSRSGVITRGHYNGSQTFTIPDGTPSGWFAIVVRSRNASTTFNCSGSDGLIIKGETSIPSTYTYSGLCTFLIFRVAGTRLALCPI